MVGTIVAGRSHYLTLQDSEGNTRRQVEQYDTRLKSLDREATELVSQRGDVLLELARHHLPEISREPIANTFREIREELLKVLLQKNQQQQQLNQELEKIEKEIPRQQVELDQVTEQLDEKVIQREKLEMVVVEQLAAHGAFPQLSERALEAEQELDCNERRIVEMGHEVKEKLPAYQQSRLFQYLHQQAYDTPAYDPLGHKWEIIKRLDCWLARMVDYTRARRSYDFLRVTPELMRAEVNRRQAVFHALMEQVEAIEDQISDDVGLTDVLAEGNRLGEQRQMLVQSLEGLAASKTNQQQRLRTLNRLQNEYYEQAVQRMKDFLATVDEARLTERAQRTPEPKDDDLVAEIRQLGNQLERIQEQKATFTRDRQSWHDKLAGLQQLLVQFRSAEYDSRRSLFSTSFHLDSHLERYLEDQESTQQIWNAIRQHQQFTSPWQDQTGGIGRTVNSEWSYVLLHSLAEVAGTALRGAASRGMERRGPIRRQRRIQTGRPRFPHRGFTNGRGF